MFSGGHYHPHSVQVSATAPFKDFDLERPNFVKILSASRTADKHCTGESNWYCLIFKQKGTARQCQQKHENLTKNTLSVPLCAIPLNICF